MLIPEEIVPQKQEEDLSLPMQERIKASLEEDQWPSEEVCHEVIGKAHLGIIPLPRTGDSFEQP